MNVRLDFQVNAIGDRYSDYNNDNVVLLKIKSGKPKEDYLCFYENK